MSAIEFFERAIAMIDAHPDLADFEAGAAPAEIEEAEKSLGVRLPTSYRMFLERFGTGDFNGREFYGVVPGNVQAKTTPSVVWFTMDERSSGGLPKELIAVSTPGDGSLICIDTSRVESSESPIVEWRYGSPPAQQDISPSFGEFFLSEIEESLQ